MAVTTGRTAEVEQILDALESQVGDLADRMLQRYLSTVPSYRTLNEETLRQVRDLSLRVIRSFLRSLRERRGPGAEESDLLRASAERRAREGVPLAGLLAAYRAGTQLAWEEARRLVAENPALAPAALDFATALMHWVDDASAAAAHAYLAEYERLATDRESARRDLVEGLLSGTLAPDEIVARAEALALDPHAPHVVALVAPVGAEPAEHALRALQHRVRAMHGDTRWSNRILAVARSRELVLAIAVRDGEEPEVAELVSSLLTTGGPSTADLRAGIGRARASLAEVAGSYREATIALASVRAATGGPIGVYGEMLVEELILREPSVGRRLASMLLDPLARSPELLETLAVYMRYGPALPAVARQLFLHPNTVAYRLSRIRDLTGRDPRTPAGMAELFLALRAQRLVGPADTAGADRGEQPIR